MKNDLRECGRNAIRIEADAIASMAERLDASFNRAVQLILDCSGRVIVSGMGKSGLIGKKIAATFNSTGIASIFLHPAEAMHGDLGLIQSDDLLMIISKSGRLGESELVLSVAKRKGVPIIFLAGTLESETARRADIVLDCTVEKEACPNNLVPTSSSTAALVMGDALAVALLQARHFTAEDFAALHPGGFLGLRLLKRVCEYHHVGNDLPLVQPDASMKEMILEMTGKRLGCVVTVDESGRVVGIFTDGDLRRLAETGTNLYNVTARDAMIKNPKTIPAEAVIDAALAIMERYAITQLPTVDPEGKLAGVIHLHDILKSKLV